jgi:hypothetical protein
MIRAGAAAPQFRCPPPSKVLVEGVWMYSCSQCSYKVKEFSHNKYHERILPFHYRERNLVLRDDGVEKLTCVEVCKHEP